MALAIAIAVSGVLFVGFLLLTAMEAKRGTRVYAAARATLDRTVENASAVIHRANLGALFFHSARAAGEYALRVGVHGILTFVRFVERTLVRFAYRLRKREEMLVSSRTFLAAWIVRAKRRFSKNKNRIK